MNGICFGVIMPPKRKVKELPIPEKREKWTDLQCSKAMDLYHGNGGSEAPAKVFEAWKKEGLHLPPEFPGRWYVLRMARRASRRLNFQPEGD